jgi:hypothetical protein
MKKYQSAIARMVHEDAEGCYKAGLLSAAEMHEFDVECLVPSAVPVREASSVGGDNRPSKLRPVGHGDRRSPKFAEQTAPDVAAARA